MNYISIKISENYQLYKYGTNNTIHKSANSYQKPTIGYGYDIKQQGFNAEDLNSKAGATIITQEQMDLLKSYCDALVKGKDESDADYNNRVKTIKENYDALISSITITQSQANTLLNNTVSSYETALNNILNECDATLSSYQKSALISVFYNTCGGTVESIKSKHGTLVALLTHMKTSNTHDKKFIGALGIWYEILYRTNPSSNGENQYGIQNRRFLEANEFWENLLSQTPSSDNAQSIIPINNYEEANIAIAFMNQNKEAMKNKLDNITNYKNNPYKYIRDNFSSAVSTFLSHQNYTGDYSINTLFTEWNLYTDLQINTSTGTTSYDNITGSDKRDLIFITGEQDGTTVHAGSGDDFIGGSSKKDIIYSGSGNDVIYTYGGDDTVYTTDGKNSDRNEVYLGAGDDTFKGGNGVDIVDGGSGATGKLSGISLESMMDTEDAINKINLGGGADIYYGGKGKDIVDGGSGDDKIFAGDGNNEINGGSGHDIIETGSGDDIIHAGTGRDKIDAGSGINHIYLGNDNFRDEVYLSNRAGGIDHIYQMTSNDIVHYNSNIVNTEYSGKDVIQTLANGAKVILHDFYDEDPGTPEHGHLPAAGANGAPLFVMPDGSVWGYGSDGKGYQDTGYTLPEGFPGKDGSNGEAIPPKAPETSPEEPNTPPAPPVDDPNDPGEDGNTPEENPDGLEEGLKGTGDQPLTQEEIDKGIARKSGSSNLYDEIRRLLKELAERIAQQTGKMITTGETTKSPLIVDLDGDGVETTTLDNGVHFDHDGNGFAEKTAWVGKDDGLLVRDLNGNGKIDDGSELFGNNTILSNGQKAANGFEALKDLDSNNDGVFDAQDAAWSEVKVWKDTNGNGRLDAGELFSLNSVGIEEINLGYQNSNLEDENGNTIGQTGSFIKNDGTTGSVKDIWFNTDLKNTVDKTQIEIPEDIKALPNITAFGNVHDLHTAMALDETGALKSLVEQFAAETDPEARQQILYNIIYHWTGVQDMPIDGRDPTQIYGKVIDDTRKLEALEEFLGKEYLGIWCWGERDPNPHGHAAPYILRAFDILAEYVNNELLTQTHYKPLLENVKLLWNETTQSWDVDVNEAVAAIQNIYNTDAEKGILIFREFENLVKSCGYNGLQKVYDAFRLLGDENGTDLDDMLSKFGLTYGTEWDDKLTGTSGVDDIQGLAGNDSIYGGAGNDTLNGGEGNDNIFGEDGDDILIGGAGNDYLIGGNGADTYIFNPGFGHDAIDNSDDNASANEPDIIQFGEGILPDNVSLGRQGYDLIITVSYDADENGYVRADDSVRIYSYFDEQGTSSATVDYITFADGTSWDYEYIITHWNSVPGVNGGVTLEGNNLDNTIEGTPYNDILIGNGGNDTINAGSGNDRIQGGRGNDILNGGAGDDTYLWNWGDGMDTIYDSGNHDKISFGSGIVFGDLKFRQEGDDLRITVKNSETQGMLIRNYFYSLDYKIEDLYFHDGSIVHLSEIPLVLQQLNSAETINLTGNGDTVYANGGNDTINGGQGNDTIYGGKGNDRVYANGGNDLIVGGTGNDYLDGGAGDDTYIYNLGDGLDTIRDNSGNNKIKFGTGIRFENLSFLRNGNNLEMAISKDRTQGIIIADFFYSDSYKNFTLLFSDNNSYNLAQMNLTLNQTDGNDNVSGTSYNDVIYGNGGDDTISGGSGDDILIGGKGNDKLYGENGNDIYIWNQGDGFDYINDSSGNNTIEFGEGISLDDLSFERSNGNGDDLFIFVNGDRNQGIHIYRFFYSSSYNNFTLKFADGSTFVPKDNDFNLTLQDGESTLVGYGYNDVLTGNNQDNAISGGSGDDILIGGKGNDTLYGESGNDTYIWNLGDGFDYINDSSGKSTIEFGKGICLENLTFERQNGNGDDLYIFVNGDRNQGVHIYRFFYSSSYNNFTLKFADGSTFVPKDNDFDLTLQDGESTLVGYSYNDVLTGNNQDNTISGGNGNDILIGGKGNDTLYGESGDDTYIWNLGDGFDYINDSSGKSTIEFGEGICLENLTFERSNGNGDDLYIFVNGDRNQGIHIYRFFYSSSYNNFTLKFADGSTFVPKDNDFNLTLLEGESTLVGYGYNDVLTGNNQDNTISGGNGNDILIGGKGNDTLYGESGNDTYIWNLGDGFDYINDSSGNNTIEFGEGISLENLTFERQNGNGDDLYIFVNGDRNQGVHIYRFFYSSSYNNFTLKFADGSTFVPKDNDFNLTLQDGESTLTGYNYNDVLTGNNQDNTISGGNGNDILIGGKGNDKLYGEIGNDTYVWNLGDGFDYINDSSGNNTIEFGEGISLEDLSFERSNGNGDDLFIFVNGDRNQGIHIYRFFYSSSYNNFTLKFADGASMPLTTDLPLSELPEVNLTLNGTAADDVLIGGNGNDIINAGDGYNDISGGKGNDIITGGYDRDTYYYNLGDGFDTISDPNGKDQIIFGEGISKDDLTFRRSGNDLWLIVNNDTTQGMKIVNFFASDDNKIEALKFADNSSMNIATSGLTLKQWDTNDDITGTPYDDIIYGNDGQDTLSGGSGKDTLIGGRGNDTLYGGSGNDTYIWNLGDGFDTIEDNAGQNIIQFGSGIAFENLSFTKIGDNLYVTVNNNPQEGVNLSRFFSNDNYKNFALQFEDGTQYALNENGLVLRQGDTFDTITGSNFNDIIYANDGNDTVNALAGNDVIYGGKGNDTIDAGNGNDTLIGGEGNDTLIGGVGDDTYIYNMGDGFDTITDTDGTDKIILGSGITADMLSFSRNGNDLRIIINNDKLQGFLLKNQFAGGTSQIETIEFADQSTLRLINKGFTFNQNDMDETIVGTPYDDVINAQGGNDTVNAGEGDDVIIGGKGNDNLNGGNGDDIYIYNLGDGFDTITETFGTDKIVLGDGISMDDLRFIREGDNLRILIKDDISQGLLLVNQFAKVDSQIEQIQFADGSFLDLVNDNLTFNQHESGETINGTDNDDTIYGNGGNDIINSGDGDDTLIGGTGNDTLNGGYGRDTYIYNLGDGADIINETRGHDKIKFGEGITKNDLTFTQEGNSLRIIIRNDINQSILINNFYQSVNYQVETIEFSDGSRFNLSTQGLTLQQTDADDLVTGTAYNDIIYGNGGHDTINSGDGNDTLIGGLGNDTLNGGSGDDTYVYNLGDGFDIISESGGNDKIVFGAGISQSNLSFERTGDDLRILINGNEIKGIQINNQFRSENYQVETIEFYDGSTLDIANADQLIQAMNSFSLANSASTDTLSDPTQNINEMYSLAANSDLTRKAV